MSIQPVSNSAGPLQGLQRYQYTTLASWHTPGRKCSILPWFVRGVNTRKVLLILTGYSSSYDRYVAFDTKRRILNFQPFCIKGVLYGIEPSRSRQDKTDQDQDKTRQDKNLSRETAQLGRPARRQHLEHL